MAKVWRYKKRFSLGELRSNAATFHHFVHASLWGGHKLGFICFVHWNAENARMENRTTNGVFGINKRSDILRNGVYCVHFFSLCV